nr:vegetative cell wall protein gp1-like [Aegilops tauschii subsp. strangulata]
MPLTPPVAAPPRLRPPSRRHLADAAPPGLLPLPPAPRHLPPELHARSIHGRPNLSPHVVVVGLLAFGHLSDPPASPSASLTPPRARLAQLQGAVSPSSLPLFLPGGSSTVPTRVCSSSPVPCRTPCVARAHTRPSAPTTAIAHTRRRPCCSAPRLAALAAPQARPDSGLPQLSPAQTPARATAPLRRPAAALAPRAEPHRRAPQPLLHPRRARRLLCAPARNPSAPSLVATLSPPLTRSGRLRLPCRGRQPARARPGPGDPAPVRVTAITRARYGLWPYDEWGPRP